MAIRRKVILNHDTGDPSVAVVDWYLYGKAKDYTKELKRELDSARRCPSPHDGKRLDYLRARISCIAELRNQLVRLKPRTEE